MCVEISGWPMNSLKKQVPGVHLKRCKVHLKQEQSLRNHQVLSSPSCNSCCPICVRLKIRGTPHKEELTALSLVSSWNPKKRANLHISSRQATGSPSAKREPPSRLKTRAARPPSKRKAILQTVLRERPWQRERKHLI